MLTLPHAWVWDCWIADDGANYHLFFLYAPRTLRDPALRHRRASIGHAVSVDLRSWTQVGDALAAGPPESFDGIATWTGSVVPAPDGTWMMYYTGINTVSDTIVQRIGMAASSDLFAWSKYDGNPVLEADPQWYETLDDHEWHDVAWRDPWVFADPGGDGWHMLITARANVGASDDRGVIGHARSPDMYSWTAQPPLSQSGAGFGQLEVPQVAEIDGRAALIFSCLTGEYADWRRRSGASAGVWAVPAPSLLGPYDVAAAQPLTTAALYAGRVVQDRWGRTVLLAFHNEAASGFVGDTTDPIPIAWVDGHTLAARLIASTASDPKERT